MKRIFGILLFSVFLFVSPLVLAQESDYQEEVMEAKVVRVLKEEQQVIEGNPQTYQKLQLTVYKGSIDGRSLIIENGLIPTADNRHYKPGDKVIVSYSKDFEGNDYFVITDYVRRSALYVLAAVFVVLTALVGGVWGIRSLAGMLFSFAVIFVFVLPQILAGQNAVVIAVLGSAIIIPVTFVLSHGMSKKTLVAAVGTVITLVLTGLIAALFVDATHLTGFSSDEAGFLQFELGERINMKGLLLAGIIIASLGILDDITISQASIVEEIRAANKKLKNREVFNRAMNVGRDHIASLVNTLILVYTGASLPLLLLFINNPRPFSEVVNYEIIADEIVRTLVGSIGLILAVPITTVLAAYYYTKKS